MSDSTEPTEGIAQHFGNVHGLRLALGLCVCYTLCIACLRGYIRWRAYGLDDLVVLVSTTLALAFFACGYVASNAGLGYPISDLIDTSQSMIDRLNGATLAANLTWIISLCLSKAAVIAMLWRTTPTPEHRRLQYGALAVIASQCVASIILVTTNCSVSNNFSWDFRGNSSNCPKQDVRWQVITGFDIVTEVILLVLPIHLTWNLQMSMKNKVIVIVAFWLRVPTIIFTILRNQTTHNLTTSDVPLLNSALVVVWQAIELSYSLAAATIAALKSFTENLNTGFGHGELVRVHGTSQAYKTSGQSATSKTSNWSRSGQKGTIAMIDTIDAPELELQPTSKPGGKISNEDMRLRPDALHNMATISSPAHDSMRSGYSITRISNGSVETRDSDERVIMQEIQYSVHYDQAPLH